MPEVVVVTGATSGVGRAVARSFARRGAHVALLARGRDGLDGAQKDVEAEGGRALALNTDVAEWEQVSAAAQAAEEALGPIDVWVNNAMTTVFARFKDVEPDEFRRATEVTYLGSVWGFRAALERMVPRNRGTVVQVGSALGYQGIPLQSAYCGAKHGIQGVFDSLRCELRADGSKVRLAIVQLPGLNTPQFDHCRSKMPRNPQPVAPIFQPEIAGEAVYWAAHHNRRELWVGTPTVYTIWGRRLAPWISERYLAKTAIDGQQTDEPADPDRPDNLFEPVPGDPGAHGDFDDQAKSDSPQTWLAKNRGRIGAVAATGAAVIAAAKASR